VPRFFNYTQTASVVAGDVPHRRGLFLHTRLPAWHRVLSCRRALADRYSRFNSTDTVWRAADVSPRSCGESARRWLDLNAREPAFALERKTVCSSFTRFCHDELHH